MKLNNKDLLKKLNDKFYNNNNGLDLNANNPINKNYINAKDTNYKYENKEIGKMSLEPPSQKYIKPFNSSVKKTQKHKKM